MSPLHIGIVLNRVKFEEKQIIMAAREKGVKITQFNNQRLIFSLNKNKDLGDVDVFLQRSLSFTRGLYSTIILEKKGYPVINPYNCLAETGDKLITTMKLVEANIPTPKTRVAFTVDSALKAIDEEFGFPLITKPIIGSWGRMVSKLNDYDAARAIFEAKEVMGNIFQKIYYIQEYIDIPPAKEEDGVIKGKPTDIRAFYLNGEVVAAIGRYRSEKDFRSNFTLGGKTLPYEVNEEMTALCKKIAKTVNGDILGIDLMETEEGYTCIEVNGTPGFEGVSRTTGVNIGEKIVSYLIERFS